MRNKMIYMEKNSNCKCDPKQNCTNHVALGVIFTQQQPCEKST